MAQLETWNFFHDALQDILLVLAVLLAFAWEELTWISGDSQKGPTK